jgi:predicted amidohydrolase
MKIDESSTLTKGEAWTEPCFSPVGYLGLSISYDIRFPELYRRLFLGGAQVLLVPAVFL